MTGVGTYAFFAYLPYAFLPFCLSASCLFAFLPFCPYYLTDARGRHLCTAECLSQSLVARGYAVG